MVKGWVGALAGWVTSAGIALAQAPAPAPWVPNLSPYAESHNSTAAVALSPAPPAASGNFYPASVNDSNLEGPGFWFQSEYLLWRLKTGHTSSHVLFGTIPTALANSPDLPPGAITNISTETTRLDYHLQSGLRIGAGIWLDGAREWAVDGSWFQLDQGHRSSGAASPGDPVIGPVFDDPLSGRQTIILYATPNVRSADLESATSNRLWGADVNLHRQLPAIYFADRLDLLVGFRHLQFSEGLDLTGHSAPTNGDPFAPTIGYFDQFGVENKFYGAQLGLASHADVGPFTADLIGKLAFGSMQESAKINGSTTFVDPFGTTVHPGGILAQPTNMGRFKRSDFAIIPEVTFNLGWRITPWLQATVGYNFLYVNNLYRVGSQIDGVDSRQVFSLASFVPNAQPTPTRPLPPGDSTSVFWAQGINVGLEFSY